VNRSPAASYIAPFALLIAFLILHAIYPLPDLAEQALVVAVSILVLALVSRPVLDFRVRRWAATLLVGAAVFLLWIAPDLLFPGYRHSAWFENPVMGSARSSLDGGVLHQPAVLGLRLIRAVVIVPIAEELFWRGWLMRWLIDPDFRTVPLGASTAASFWIVALLFAAEHGPYWDVGLLAGVAYNQWITRTKSLGDLVLAHAMTNACLSVYVIAAGKWEYWM
jgi:CAAX prenyl protease-like protein